jgi:hypothetical protein
VQVAWLDGCAWDGFGGGAYTVHSQEWLGLLVAGLPGCTLDRVVVMLTPCTAKSVCATKAKALYLGHQSLDGGAAGPGPVCWMSG